MPPYLVNPPIRKRKVREVRAKIKAGMYPGPAAIDGAIDGLLNMLLMDEAIASVRLSRDPGCQTVYEKPQARRE